MISSGSAATNFQRLPERAAAMVQHNPSAVSAIPKTNKLWKCSQSGQIDQAKLLKNQLEKSAKNEFWIRIIEYLM